MKKFQIVGTHPRLGISRIFALYAPENELADYLERGKADGWTDLSVHNQPQPSLWPDEDAPPSASASSVLPASPKKRGRPCRSSAEPSRVSGTRSSRSQRKERQPE